MKFSTISVTYKRVCARASACFWFPCVLIIFPISLSFPPFASFIRTSAGDGKCNHETRRRDVAWGNMFLVDKHARPSCPAFLARFSILLGKAICNLHESAWPSLEVIWCFLFLPLRFSLSYSHERNSSTFYVASINISFSVNLARYLVFLGFLQKLFSYI